jgi:hypothetical protein
MNQNVCGMEQSWPNLSYTLGTFMDGTKPRKTSVMVISVPVEIRTSRLRNTSQEFNCLR